MSASSSGLRVNQQAATFGIGSGSGQSSRAPFRLLRLLFVNVQPVRTRLEASQRTLPGRYRFVAAGDRRRYADTEFSYEFAGLAASSFGLPTTQLEPMMPTSRRAEPDACSLLDTDHRNVKKLFKEYEELAHSRAASAESKKRELANHICTELTVHAQIEEEIFYPAVRAAIKETDLLDEAEVEHASAKDLIAQIQEATEIDEKFDAKVIVLGEYIDHHVKEERNEIFVKARAARGLDLVAMRGQLAARKEELMEELGAMA